MTHQGTSITGNVGPNELEAIKTELSRHRAALVSHAHSVRITQSLADYLRSMRDRRWEPGTLDCGVFMADWVRARTGVDPIADVRGTYDNEKGFLRILRREGGFEASCAARLKAAGWRETKNPKAGDVIVVMAPYAVRRGETQRRPTGGLFVGTDRHAVMTSDLGLVVVKKELLPLVKAWTFHG